MFASYWFSRQQLLSRQSKGFCFIPISYRVHFPRQTKQKKLVHLVAWLQASRRWRPSARSCKLFEEASEQGVVSATYRWLLFSNGYFFSRREIPKSIGSLSRVAGRSVTFRKRVKSQLCFLFLSFPASLLLIEVIQRVELDRCIWKWCPASSCVPPMFFFLFYFFLSPHAPPDGSFFFSGENKWLIKQISCNWSCWMSRWAWTYGPQTLGIRARSVWWGLCAEGTERVERNTRGKGGEVTLCAEVKLFFFFFF